MKTLRALFIGGLLLVATQVVSGQTATTDITIYVQSSDAPYLYAWVYEGTEGYTCNGDWPGTLMTEQTEVKGTVFWKKTFSEDDMHGLASLNIIFNTGDSGYQTSDIEGITSDCFFSYDGYYGYTNVTSQYAVIPDAPVQNGSYYLRNVATGKFWGCGSKWGTQSSVVDLPLLLTLTYQADGTYVMKAPTGKSISPDDQQYYFHHFGFDTEQETYYMDQDECGPSYIVYLTIAKNGEYFTISEGSEHFGYDGTTALRKKTTVDNTTLWEIITEEQYKAELLERMTTATSSNPVEITGLIGNSDFNNYGYWEIAADIYKLDGGGTDNEADNNFCAESWHSDFYLHQTVSNLPSGKYKLTAQGFYRQDGTDDTHLPVFFANGQTSLFVNNTDATEYDMATAARSFANGLYPIDPIIVNLQEEGNLTIGAKLEGNTYLWCIWDNFRLYYLGQEQGLMGDVNGDGVVDLSDAAMVVFYSLGKNPVGFVKTVADMNSDGVIDFSDALIIKDKSF